ncbi:MAG: zinc-ribbon domain-containing protein [Lentisphaerae bacterium]|nr:zinc-ribbon domain-containing protein [Lentisphaerota bacterium]
MFCPQCGTKNTQEAQFCVSCGTQLSLVAEPALRHPASSITTPRFAGFWFRTLAVVIDFVLCQVASVFLVLPLGFALGASMAGTSSVSEIEATAEGLGFVLGVLIQWLWFTIPESSKWQATIGKKMVGLKVTDENGERIGFGKANGRYWSKILSAILLFVGFLMVAFTAKKQGLHDKIAGTLVVKENA